MPTNRWEEDFQGFVTVKNRLRYNPRHQPTKGALNSQLRVQVRCGCSPEVIGRLVSRGADVNCVDPLGYTPLLTAVAADQLANRNEIVTVLCELGADVNYTNDLFFMDTPLHIAASHRCQQVVKTLLRFGANVDLRNHAGYTPLHVASMNGNSEIVKLLYLRGADVQSTELYCCYSPVHLAAAGGHCEVLEILVLHCGASISQQDFRGFTAVDKCVSKEMLNFLIEQHRNPRALMNLCLYVVRTLVVESSCEVNTLPLPHTLKKKVEMKT